jgi:hypothetical protein
MATKNKAQRFLDKIVKGRPKPQAPTAGYLASGRRYDNGGKKRK